VNTPAPAQAHVAAGPVPDLSVVLPCYNESKVIAETHRRVTAVCRAAVHSYEILIVNDGSTDGSWAELLRLAKEDPSLVAVNLSRNHGHQLAVSAGLHCCRGDRVLIMDADLQDPPELLPEMLRKMDEGADVVYAQRRSRPGDAPMKRLFCALFYRLLERLADTHIPLDTGDFRLISRRLCDLIVSMPERHRFIRGMVSWAGYQQVAVLYDRDARFAGETKYPLRKLVALAVDGIISSSLKPLAFATFIGLIAASVGLLLLLYALYSWLFVGRTPAGWASLLITVVFMGGLQLVVLGVMGEYLGRIHEQTRGRPMFLIDKVVRAEPPPPRQG
jgi:glycosyltransferase involved in cell wall biosynthesis